MRLTLYSPVVDHQVIEFARTLLPGWSLQLEGEPARWGTARFRSAQGMLEFSSLEFTAPQDAFSKIILGTSSHFWRRKELSEAVREDLLDFVSETQWLVGVVGTSEYLPEEFFRRVALELARRLGGRVFNGTDLISPEPMG
jgi:hypothetical protein